MKFDGRNEQYHALYDSNYRFGYELETALLLSRLARGSGAFYDVGANWGYFSLLLAATPNFHGAIFAFEPNRRVLVDLESMIGQANLGSRVKPFGIGIGSEASELTLVEVDKFKTGLGHLTSSGHGYSVPVRPLDDLGLAAPDMIKIDAEGMELDVLRGARDILQRNRPHLVFESFVDFEKPEATILPLEYLLEQGYRLFNPSLIFKVDDGHVHASYGDPFDLLLGMDSNPSTCLVEMTTSTRFLMSHQMNVFACHESRVHELEAFEIGQFQGDTF
jgi:FkbM family methyltransferase